jgi:hypothetical protein
MVRPSRIGSIGLSQPARSRWRAAGSPVQPVMVGGQVEFADAAGNRGAALDAHQPVVLAQVVADLALHVEQRGGGLLDLVERAGKRRLGDVGIVAEGQQDLALALEFLHQVELEVGAAGDIEDLEQRHQRDVVLLRVVRSDEVAGLVEQVLQAQQSANALVERIFVVITPRRAVG